MSTNLKHLKEIQEIASKIRKMNEQAIFEDEFDVEEPFMDGEIEQTEVQQDEPKSLEDKGMQELDKVGALDKIRLICLDGMKELAQQSQADSAQFLALNKIFAICNKGTEDKEENVNK